MRRPLPRRKSLGFLPGIGAFFVGVAMNGLHESHRVALAFLITGLGLSAVWLVAVATGPILRLARRTGDDDLHATFEAVPEEQPGYLRLGIRNDGLSMRDAGMNLLVPKRLEGRGAIQRVSANGERLHTGTEAETAEEVEPGEPSIYWAETGLKIQGGGHTTQFYFFIGYGLPPGSYPARLKLYDDADQPRRLEVDGTFLYGPRKIDAEQRRGVLDSVRQEFGWNRGQLRMALGTGRYVLSDNSAPFATRYAGFNSFADRDGVDAPYLPRIADAYAELKRVGEIIDNGAEWLRPEDRVEWALACVLDGIVAAESALTLEPAA